MVQVIKNNKIELRDVRKDCVKIVMIIMKDMDGTLPKDGKS